jgi:sirohydrochlorin ferrochelatase
VVPLLLSRGTHHSRDLPPEATPPLGPDPLLTDVLLDRVHAAEIATGTPLLLAATGSQDPTGIADVQTQAALLEAAWNAPVKAGFVTAAPRLPAVRQEMESAYGRRPAVVSYFLAPGRLPSSAHPDTAHLGTHPGLVDLVLDRYHVAVLSRDWSARAFAHASAQTFAAPPFAPDGVTRMGL